MTTYERADSLLRHRTPWLSEVGTLVIDEIQSLGLPGRGARLESTIIRFKKIVENLQIVGLSATVGMPELLAEWLECELVESNERKVPLLVAVATRPNRDEAVRTYTMKTIQTNGQVIIFHRTRKEAEAETKRLMPHVSRHLTEEERALLQSTLGSIEYFDAYLPEGLSSAMLNGVAYHNASLNGGARRMVERLFRKGLIRVICATSTLSTGMDLPARTVIIASCRSPANYNELLPANRVHQMLGRAGRPGMDRKGYGFVIAQSKGQAEEIKRRYFIESTDDLGATVLLPKYDPVNSVLGDSKVLTEQLLVALDMLREGSIEDVEDFLLAPSLLTFRSVRQSQPTMRLFILGEITAEAVIERHGFMDTVRAGRGDVLGTVDLREKTEHIIGGLVTETGGASYTCRFSTRVTQSGTMEGPQCSCGKPLDASGVLCQHLVTLGLQAIQQEPERADFIIPLALDEISPLRVLVRLGLVEGGESSGTYRPTPLGLLVSRLYLRIDTAREMLAMMPLIEEPQSFVRFLLHLIEIDTGTNLEQPHERLLTLAASTTMPFDQLSEYSGIPTGDIYTFLQHARWLSYAVMAIAKKGNLLELSDMAQRLYEEVDARFTGGT